MTAAIKQPDLRSKLVRNEGRHYGTVVQLRLKEAHYKALGDLQNLLEKSSGTRPSHSVILRRALMGYLMRAAKLNTEQLEEEMELIRLYCR